VHAFFIIQAGHITESQLVIHVLEEKVEKPPKMDGLTVINRGCAQINARGKITVKEDCKVGTRLVRIKARSQRSNGESKLTFKLER